METGQRDNQLSVQAERALLVGVLLPDFGGDPQDPLAELRSLADTAGAEVLGELLQKKRKPEPGTFIGTGKLRQLQAMVQTHQAHVVIFENDLSPRQIANIEEAIECKVLDRSELILDIFAARAQTLEARMQVELAQLQYTYPRLRAMWSHLERIVGGAPTGIGTRGPGEQQLEIDRRIVRNKLAQLRREIAEVQARKTREVAQRNSDFYTVGLVGYTNAGKSTLFNTVTDAGTYADDKLFATLSTRTRAWKLTSPDGTLTDEVMLSDTVGFVRDLPHHLVASFKATLEEAVASDLLLIVLDVSHPRCRQQLETVHEVLDAIGATTPQRLLVLNKTDAVTHNAELLALRAEYPDCLAVSAKTGAGVEALIERVRALAGGEFRDMRITLPSRAGKSIQFLERRTRVLDRDYAEDGQSVTLTVHMGTRQLQQLRSIGEGFTLDDATQRAVTPPASGWGTASEAGADA